VKYAHGHVLLAKEEMVLQEMIIILGVFCIRAKNINNLRGENNTLKNNASNKHIHCSHGQFFRTRRHGCYL